MPFYSENTTEPKRSFRFLFELAGVGGQAMQSYFVKDVKKPTLQMEAGPQVKYVQHTFKYPGRVMWQDVNVTVYDPGGANDGGKILYNMIARSGYAIPQDTPGAGTRTAESISKRKANTAIGSPRIKQIDDNAEIIEEWTLHNAYLANVDFGQLSYDTDEMVNIALTITYDYATLLNIGGVQPAADPRVLAGSA